jgi:hypothetical protein
VTTLDDDINAAAAHSVALSRDRPGASLDYSLSSFDLVEAMLAEASEYVSSMTMREIDTLVTSVGSYLLESARRAVGGTFNWLDEANEPILVVGDSTSHVALAAWSKVRGRLMGDVADNIPFHMSGFFDRVRGHKPGDRVLFR